jgi:hypothetical protein
VIIFGEGIIKVPGVTKIDSIRFNPWKRERSIRGDDIGILRQIPAKLTKNPKPSLVITM